MTYIHVYRPKWLIVANSVLYVGLTSQLGVAFGHIKWH